MQLVDAEKLALDLMKHFGLTNWRLEWSESKRSFGTCQHGHISGGTITLSRVLVLRNTQEQVEDTIRHEIAHALCDPKEKHGAAWKAMCKVTGARPKRCFTDAEVNSPEGDWQATCPECGKVYTLFKEPRRDKWCPAWECKHRLREFGTSRFDPLLKLVWKHKRAIAMSKPPQHAIEAMKALLREKGTK